MSNVNGPNRMPLLSPDVGDVVFNLNVGGFQRIYRRMRVVRLTATQVETIDVLKRRTRYWRKNGYQISNRSNHLTLIEPEGYATFEAKHEVGKPLVDDLELRALA